MSFVCVLINVYSILHCTTLRYTILHYTTVKPFALTPAAIISPRLLCEPTYTVQPAEPNYPILTSGSPVTGKISCPLASGPVIYKYYRIGVTSPCDNINIFMTSQSSSGTGTGTGTGNGRAEFVVGRYPNIVPNDTSVQ
jgi:hypothetical protein